MNATQALAHANMDLHVQTNQPDLSVNVLQVDTYESEL